MRSSLTKSVSVAAAVACTLVSGAQAAMTISNAKTKNVTCTGGVCTSTAKKAVINATDLANMLSTSDVTLKTDTKARDILVNAAFSWTSTHRLTLDAYQTITVQRVVTVAGQGGLTLITNDGGSGGDYFFVAPGRVIFWDLASSLSENGVGYVLVDSLSALKSAVAQNSAGAYALAKDFKSDRTYTNSPLPSFSGALDGLGNNITGLTIKTTNVKHAAGLIGTNSGTIRNIGILNATVSGNTATGALVGINHGEIDYAQSSGALSNGVIGRHGGSVGGLIGENDNVVRHSSSAATITGSTGYTGGLIGYNKGLVDSAYADGTVTSGFMTGGLVGQNEGTITNSYADGAVEAKTNGYGIGGLVGLNLGDIDHSHASGTVSNDDGGSAGGLAYQNDGIITSSYATGSVTGEAVGGLVAINDNKITRSFATGTVFALGVAGGLVGVNSDPYGATLIDECYANGTVGIRYEGGGSSAGGLVGDNLGPVQNSYATGNPSSLSGGQVGGLVGHNVLTNYGVLGTVRNAYSTGAPSGGQYTGGSVGLDATPAGNLNGLYWDTDTSGISNLAQGAGSPTNDPGIAGLTDAQLKSALPAGFDPNVWAQSASINNGYPYLLANPPQ